MPTAWQRVAPSFFLEVRITPEPIQLVLQPALPAMLPLPPAAETIR